MKVRNYLILGLFFLGGCATTAKYEAILETWINKDITALIDSMGYPDNAVNLPNGNTVYIFSSINSYVEPVHTHVAFHSVGDVMYADTLFMGGQTYTNWCKTYFEVNPENIIIKWRIEGNNCVSR